MDTIEHAQKMDELGFKPSSGNIVNILDRHGIPHNKWNRCQVWSVDGELLSGMTYTELYQWLGY